MTSTERVHASRLDRPRTEELYRSMARVLQRAVRDGRLPWTDTVIDLRDELEELEVGPTKRRLTESEREALARKLLS